MFLASLDLAKSPLPCLPCTLQLASVAPENGQTQAGRPASLLFTSGSPRLEHSQCLGLDLEVWISQFDLSPASGLFCLTWQCLVQGL